MANEIGRLFISVTADIAGFTKGMADVTKQSRDMQKNLDKIRGVMVGVGVGVATAIGKMTLDYAKAGDEIYELSKKTGVSTKSLSELKYVFSQTGGSLEGFETSLRFMSQALSDANRGTGAALPLLQTLGLNISDLMAMSPEEQFWAMADAVSGLTSQTERVDAATTLWGSRTGTDLLPMLAEGKGAISDMRQEANDLNLVYDDVAAKQSNELIDSINTMKGAFNGLRNEVAEVVLPAMTTFVTNVSDGLKGVISWIEGDPGVKKALEGFGAFAGSTALLAGLDLFLNKLGGIRKAAWGLVAALVGVQSVSGPAGWGTLAAGIGRMAATIGLLDEAFNMQLVEGTPLAGLLGKIPGSIYGEDYGKDKEKAPFSPPPVPEGYATWGAYMEATGKYQAAGGGVGGVNFSKEQKQNAILAEWQRQGIYAPTDYVPSFRYGGIVPGSPGEPRLVMAHGGEAFAGIGNRLGVTNNITIQVQGSVVTERDLANHLRETLLKIQSQNHTSGFI